MTANPPEWWQEASGDDLALVGAKIGENAFAGLEDAGAALRQLKMRGSRSTEKRNEDIKRAAAALKYITEDMGWFASDRPAVTFAAMEFSQDEVDEMSQTYLVRAERVRKGLHRELERIGIPTDGRTLQGRKLLDSVRVGA